MIFLLQGRRRYRTQAQQKGAEIRAAGGTYRGGYTREEEAEIRAGKRKYGK